MVFTSSFPVFVLLAALLGAGTALVYPTFLAAIAEYAPTAQRAPSVGIFRLWRDSSHLHSISSISPPIVEPAGLLLPVTIS